ncbi:MAG: pyridoxal phosphate-dependent aminotransferase [Acidobacteriota bacterium]
MRLADRMNRFGASPTMAAKQAAALLRARGESIIDLSVGEPDFPTPEHVVAAAQAALENGKTHYTAAAGLPALREALATYLSGIAGVGIDADRVVVTCGGKSALLYVILALVQAGDEVVIPAPCWVSFPDQVRLAGGEPVLVPGRAESGFGPDVAALGAALTDRTRLMIVNSPVNPTGAVMRPGDWPELIAVCRRRGVILLSDETYNELVHDDGPIDTILKHAGGSDEGVVIVNSFSKTWSMTGWRVGYVCGPLPLVRAVTRLQSQDTTHPATFAQHGAIAALTGPGDATMMMRSEYRRRCRLMLDELRTLAGFSCAPPRGAFYLFPDVTGAMERKSCADDGEFADRLLHEAHVAVVAGSAFCGPGCVRMSYAVADDDLHEAMRRIREWLASS